MVARPHALSSIATGADWHKPPGLAPMPRMLAPPNAGTRDLDQVSRPAGSREVGYAGRSRIIWCDWSEETISGHLDRSYGSHRCGPTLSPYWGMGNAVSLVWENVVPWEEGLRHEGPKTGEARRLTMGGVVTALRSEDV